MKLPLQVTFRSMEPSDEIESLVGERSARLDRLAEDIMNCRVVI